MPCMILYTVRGATFIYFAIQIIDIPTPFGDIIVAFWVSEVSEKINKSLHMQL